ncbi:unnamed protein product [Rotaria sp. Silwood1]|nr:unnamed protein product [Rotaria sp. Silwood1]
MADEKAISKIETDTTETIDHGISELVRIVNNHLNPVSSTVSSTSGSTRTYTPPLMGTSARAAKRRIDSDSGPIRIEGTDIYNQQLQHHYQNVRHILEDQQQQQELHISNVDTPPDSRQSFNAKRDFFEQRFKTPPPTYDSPPRQQQAQKIVTTITTTTTAAPKINTHDRTSSSSNESPSVDRVLEQAVELQKMSNINPNKNDSQTPVIIERTEEYQVFLDSSNHEVRRTPSISRTSIVNITKSGHATDLDQAQAQVERLTDDHEAIQHLTRVLQEHNVTTINEYKRLPSVTNQNLASSSLTTSPSDVLIDRTNLPITSEFAVIDALVYNPIGTIDGKYHNLLNKRYNDIRTNLGNPEYINSLKQSATTTTKTKTKKESKKKSKEKKPKEKKSKKKASSKTDTIEQAVVTSDVNAPESLLTQTTEPITTTALVEQTPLIDPKEKKKQDKENKKASKTKSKQKSKNEDYQVVDAIISSPISLRLPDPYLVKYKVNPPLSPSSPLQSIPSSVTPNTVVATTTTTTTTTTATTAATTPKDTTTPIVEKNQTLYHLVKIVSELQTHHAAALKAALNTVPPPTMTTTAESKEPVILTNQSVPVINEVVYQQPLLKQPDLVISPSHQTETNLQSESIKPRVIYRYMDEQGRILKISSVPPSELREQPAQAYAYYTTEPPYLYGRHIAIDDERRYPLPQYEQHATWQGEPKLPTTVTREDLELRDRRVPQLSEQYAPGGRTIPVSVEHERSSKNSSQQQSQRIYHYPNQQNVKLAWLPLSYPADQAIPPTGAAGYETDSTVSERSATHRTYDYVPIDSHYRYSNRPPYDDYYYNRSPGPSYYRPPPSVYYGGRGMSPEYGGLSRNYIEVFRGGDFRETKPSEIYSLPLSEQMRTSPNYPSSSRHSRYDQYQSERYGTMSNRNTSTPSSPPVYCSNSLPKSRYQHNIPPSTVHASTYYTHRSPYHHRTVQSSPNPECKSYVRHSKSFDYRPLRTKLQREYKITPNLLVDEWDYPQTSNNMKYSTTTSTTNRSGVSSPDDVFIKKPNERSNELYERHDYDLLELSRQKLQSRIYDSQPIYKAFALHNFYPETDRELPFKKGDTILVKRRINDDWLEGEHQGLTGIFPLNHVELFPYEIIEQENPNEKEQQIEGEAIVKYDFIPEKTYELQLRKGDKVILLRKFDNNWYEGRLNHVEGIFPADYVETLREPKSKSLMLSNQNEHTTNIIKMPKSALKNSNRLQQTATEQINIVPESPIPMQKCQVLYDYIPQNVDELEIRVGDIINIVEMCDDGWYCGIMEKSTHGNNMSFGTFPGNYVKLLPG